MTSPGLAGEKKNDGLKSPNPVPVVLGTPAIEGDKFGWLMIGMMTRVMRFQSSAILAGITGWTLRT
jgi:hypothetical protein